MYLFKFVLLLLTGRCVWDSLTPAGGMLVALPGSCVVSLAHWCAHRTIMTSLPEEWKIRIEIPRSFWYEGTIPLSMITPLRQ